MAYLLTDIEKSEVRLQLSANLTQDGLSDLQIDAESISGEAIDYVFGKVSEHLVLTRLDVTKKSLVAQIQNGTSDAIDTFVTSVLSARQGKMFRRAVVYRAAGNAAFVVQSVTAEVAAGISQRRQSSPAEVKRAELYQKCDTQIELIRDASPSDPVEDQTEIAKEAARALTLAATSRGATPTEVPETTGRGGGGGGLIVEHLDISALDAGVPELTSYMAFMKIGSSVLERGTMQQILNLASQAVFNIGALNSVTPEPGDFLPIQDISNANTNAKTTIQAIVSLFNRFSPTKANLYPSIKQILQAAANVSITPDDDNNELDIAAAGGGGGGGGGFLISGLISDNFNLDWANEGAASDWFAFGDRSAPGMPNDKHTLYALAKAIVDQGILELFGNTYLTDFRSGYTLPIANTTPNPDTYHSINAQDLLSPAFKNYGLEIPTTVLTEGGFQQIQGMCYVNGSLYIQDHTSHNIRVYTKGVRDTSKEFAGTIFTALSATWVHGGITSDGTYLYVANAESNVRHVYAFNLETKARDTSKEFTLPSTITVSGANAISYQMVDLAWDGTSVLIALNNTTLCRIIAYTDGTRDTTKDKVLSNVGTHFNIEMHQGHLIVADTRNDVVWSHETYATHAGQVLIPKLAQHYMTQDDQPTVHGLASDGTFLYLGEVGDRVYWYLTPEGFATVAELAKSLMKATQAKAEAGTDNTDYMTALRVKQAIEALGFSGAYADLTGKPSIPQALTKATQAKAEAGTDNTDYMTALRVKQAIEALSDNPQDELEALFAVMAQGREISDRTWKDDNLTTDASTQLLVSTNNTNVPFGTADNYLGMYANYSNSKDKPLLDSIDAGDVIMVTDAVTPTQWLVFKVAGTDYAVGSNANVIQIWFDDDDVLYQHGLNEYDDNWVENDTAQIYIIKQMLDADGTNIGTALRASMLTGVEETDASLSAATKLLLDNFNEVSLGELFEHHDQNHTGFTELTGYNFKTGSQTPNAGDVAYDAALPGGSTGAYYIKPKTDDDKALLKKILIAHKTVYFEVDATRFVKFQPTGTPTELFGRLVGSYAADSFAEQGAALTNNHAVTLDIASNIPARSEYRNIAFKAFAWDNLTQLTTLADDDSLIAWDKSTGGIVRIEKSDLITYTKANLYAGVKAILQASTGVTITADDTDNELDISASGGGGATQTTIATGRTRTGSSGPDQRKVNLTTADQTAIKTAWTAGKNIAIRTNGTSWQGGFFWRNLKSESMPPAAQLNFSGGGSQGGVNGHGAQLSFATNGDVLMYVALALSASDTVDVYSIG